MEKLSRRGTIGGSSVALATMLAVGGAMLGRADELRAAFAGLYI